MLAHLCLPARLPLRHPLLEHVAEPFGVDAFAADLLLEHRPYRFDIEIVGDEQLVQVEEVTRLQALDDAAELLGRDLVECVDADLDVGLVGISGEQG